MSTCRVLVARSSHPGCSTVVSVLDSMPDVRVIGAPRSFAEAEAIARHHQPRLIITPDEVDGERAIPFLHRLRRHVVTTRFLVACDDFRSDELALISEAGISCFLYWSDLLANLPENLGVAISGNAVLLSNNLAAAHLADERYRQHDDDSPMDINAREIEVMRGLIEGLTHSGIAHQMGVAPRTVERTIERLKDKLEAPNSHALVMKAGQRGLIP